MTKLKKLLLVFALLLVLVPSAIFLASCGCTPVDPTPGPGPEFTITGDWKIAALVVVGEDHEERYNVGDLISEDETLTDYYITLNFTTSTVTIKYFENSEPIVLDYEKVAEGVYVTEVYIEGIRLKFTLIENNNLKMEATYNFGEENEVAQPRYNIFVKGKATQPEEFSIIGDWKLKTLGVIINDVETLINIGENFDGKPVEDNFATVNFTEEKISIGGQVIMNFTDLNYTKNGNIYTTEQFENQYINGKYQLTLLEDNSLKLEFLMYNSETDNFELVEGFFILIKGQASQPEGPIKYSLAPNIFGEEVSLEGFSAELVLFSDGTYSFTQTEAYNYLEETSLIEGNWSLNNGQKKLISITKYAKINKLVGNIISEEEYEGDAAYAEVYNDFNQSFLSGFIINENLVIYFMADMPPLVNEEAGNIIFAGGMLKLYGINFDFFIPLDPDNEWTEELIFEMLSSEEVYNEAEGMYSVGVITRDGFEEYHPIYNNIRFVEIAIGAEGETTDLKAWLTLPGDTVETEITLKCYFASEPPAEFMNIMNPSRITYNNSTIHNRDQVLKGTTLSEFIAGIEIGIDNDNNVPMTEDMVEGWPVGDHTGWATIKITYQGLNDYYRLYFYDNEITTVISSGINELVVVEKGQNLTEAISNLEAYVEFTGNTNDSIRFDLSEAELTVEGLTIEEGKITNPEGVYLVTFKISGMSHIYSYWDEEAGQQIDETINIPDFEIIAVVVVVDEEDSTLKFVTSFDIEGEILGTDNGGSESDTLDFNGAKLKVYFDNDSENPTIIDIDESMVKNFDVSDGSQYFGINVDIKYAYEYKGIEYNLIYSYRKETPKQYTIRFVYDDNGTETEIWSITEDYSTEIFFPTSIEGHPELKIISWESNNPNYSFWRAEEGFRTSVSDSDVTFTAVFGTQEQSDPIEGEWVFAEDPTDQNWISATISFENGSFTLSVPDLFEDGEWTGTWVFLSGNSYNITLTDQEVIPGYTFGGYAFINEGALFISIQKEGEETSDYKFIRT